MLLQRHSVKVIGNEIGNPHHRLIFTSAGARVYENLPARQTPTTGIATTERVKKLNFPPFVKDLFCGKFNKSMLSYAEVLNYDRHRALETMIQQISSFLDNRKTGILDANSQISPEIVAWCKSEGLHGLMGPPGQGGKDLLVTEVARIHEELGRDLSLSEYLYCADILGYKAILEHGNARQHDKYLESLSNGSVLATLCSTEAGAGADPNSIQTYAKYNPDDETYTIKGTKTWVANALSSQVFIVIAKGKSKNYMGEEETSLSAFLVDNSEVSGVHVRERYDSTALSGLNFADVDMDCKVSKNSVLGQLGEGHQIMQAIQNQNKFLMAAGLITNLKSLLDYTIEHCNTRKQFGLHLTKFNLVKHQIAKMAQRLYCLESMVYLTAGLNDISEYPDTELESAIVKLYAAETSDFIVKTCSSLLGCQSVLEDSPAMLYLKQNQFLQNYHGSSNILKTFIPVSGIIHLMQQVGPEIMKKASGTHFLTMMSWTNHMRRHKADTAPLTHKLSDCVHPRMMTTASKLEYIVEKIPFLATNMFIKHKLEIPEPQLEKLADIVIETFAMTCALSRSNRSYIVGNLHGEHETSLSIPYINDARLRCKQLFLELQNWEGEEDERQEQTWVQIGYQIADQKGYNIIVRSRIMSSGNNSNNLTNIKDLKPGLHNISLQFIVLEKNQPTTTKENQEVRTVKVADKTGMANLTVWNEIGKALQQGDIIRMSKGYTSMFKNSLTIYSTKNGEFVKVGDFCMIFSETPNMSEPNPELAAQYEKEEAERKERKSGGGDRNSSRGSSGNSGGGNSNNGGSGSKGTWGSSGGSNSDPRKRKNDNR